MSNDNNDLDGWWKILSRHEKKASLITNYAKAITGTVAVGVIAYTAIVFCYPTIVATGWQLFRYGIVILSSAILLGHVYRVINPVIACWLAGYLLILSLVVNVNTEINVDLRAFNITATGCLFVTIVARELFEANRAINAIFRIIESNNRVDFEGSSLHGQSAALHKQSSNLHQQQAEQIGKLQGVITKLIDRQETLNNRISELESRGSD